MADEHIIESHSGDVHITIKGKEYLSFCSNNYLNIDSQFMKEQLQKGVEQWGASSGVRFISGTYDIHHKLESRLANFFGKEDSVLYLSCYNANVGLFQCLLTDMDAVISEEKNHASIIDGIRLCKAQRYRYKHLDMVDLEEQLKTAKNALHVKNELVEHTILISTDGVFSMSGEIANIPDVIALAKKYTDNNFKVLVHVDDSHGSFVLGKTGRGTPELQNCMDGIDILTTTLGKALGCNGGATISSKEIIGKLRKSRPYVFSNNLAPAMCHLANECLEYINNTMFENLDHKVKYFKGRAGNLPIQVDKTPIIKVLLGEDERAKELEKKLFDMGILCVGFCYPVVAKKQSILRIQLSNGHTLRDIDTLINALKECLDY